jgi:hypothetical protein
LNNPADNDQESAEGQGKPQPPPAAPTTTVDTKNNNPKSTNASGQPGNADKRKHTSLEIIGFVVAFFALCATVRQGYVTFDAERRTLRAYVFVDTVSLLNFDSPDYAVDLKIKNTGANARLQHRLLDGHGHH